METLACRPAALAAELTRGGAGVIVVGGTARWLRAGRRRPRDLDVVVEPMTIPALVSALAGLGVVASAASLTRCRDLRFATGWGPLDVFVAPCPPCAPVDVDGVLVAVEL